MFASNDTKTKMAVISGWYGPYGSTRPRGHVRHLAFVVIGGSQVRNGSKAVILGGDLFGQKSPCQCLIVGFHDMFLASNVTHVAVISGWNGSYGSMGPRGHVRGLDLVMGSMPSPQWVPSGGWRGSLFGGKYPCRRGIQWPLLAYIATQVTVISGCSSLSVFI